MTNTLKVNAYVEITPEDFTKVDGIIGDHRGEMPEDIKTHVNEVLYEYDKSQKKPSWVNELPEGDGAACIFWQGFCIVRGRQ